MATQQARIDDMTMRIEVRRALLWAPCAPRIVVPLTLILSLVSCFSLPFLGFFFFFLREGFVLCIADPAARLSHRRSSSLGVLTPLPLDPPSRAYATEPERRGRVRLHLPPSPEAIRRTAHDAAPHGFGEDGGSLSFSLSLRFCAKPSTHAFFFFSFLFFQKRAVDS